MASKYPRKATAAGRRRSTAALGPSGDGEAGMVGPLARRDEDDTEYLTTTTTDAARSGTAALSVTQQQQVRDLLDLALDRFNVTEEAESELRKNMREDQRFYNGEQWPDHIKVARQTRGSPCMTINRMTHFVRQVTNSARANKPAIQVNPVDSGSDPDTAEVLQDICRHVEIASGASIAYETAAEHQAIMGRGFIRVATEWDDDEGFQQRIVIKRVRNPHTIYVDPGCREVDYSDAEYAFVTEDLTRREYKRRFNKTDADLVSLDAFMTQGDAPAHWRRADRVRIGEYWYAEYSPYDIAQIEVPGNVELGEPARKVLVVPQSALRAQKQQYRDTAGIGQPINEAALDATDIPGVRVLQTRTIFRRQIKQCVINAQEILDGNADKTAGRDWPGKWIPIVPVLGDESEIDGRLDVRGMVRNSKDAQRMYNYWVSAATETIALAPRAPWIGYAGQFRNFETQWKTANTVNHAYLEVNPITIEGTLAPLPKRDIEEPAIQAIMIALRQADYDLKATMGLFDPSLGQQGPEESGKAILARQRQGEVANSNYSDNLARAIRRVGYIIIDLAPKIYDVPTVLRIKGDDSEKTRPVMVYAGKDNQPPLPEGVPDLSVLAKNKGVTGIYDLAAGRYDVSVTVGPSYPSRRAEAVDAMVQVVTRSPELLPAIGDLLFGNMDWPGAKQIAKRLARAVPPHLQDPEDGQEIPPQARAQMAQMQQQIEEMGQMLQQLQLERATKAQELAMKGQIAAAESQAKERIAAETAAAQERVAAMEAKAMLAKVELEARFEQQQALIESRLKRQEMAVQGQIDAMITRLEAMLAPKPAPQEARPS